MTEPAIRIIPYDKAVPDCGSFEARFADGRPSQYFYFDDIASRRLRPEQVDRNTALEQANTFARSQRATNENAERAGMLARRRLVAGR